MFNDSFFMPFMFFLSGIFAWPSLTRNGPSKYIQNRVKRLGVPFLITILFAPLMFYPAYAYRTPWFKRDFLDFGTQWLSLGFWPSGSGWFIAVLFSFDCLLCALYSSPEFQRAVEKTIDYSNKKPVHFLVNFFIFAAALYLPLAYKWGEGSWTIFGPFQIQSSRMLIYPLFFFAGICSGGRGSKSTLLNSGDTTSKIQDSIRNPLTHNWENWISAALANFIFWKGMRDTPNTHLWNFFFVTSAVLYSLAFLAVFLRFCNFRFKVLDNLTANAYGIYFVHYLINNWIQLFFAGLNISVQLKGMLVFSLVLGLSWFISEGLRRYTPLSSVL